MSSSINIDESVEAEEGLELDVSADAEADAEIEIESEEGNPDPFDMGQNDVDKIMKRYEN